MGVYLLVFGSFLHLGFHNYALYLLSGNLAYIWFASSLNVGTEAIRAGRMFVGKTVFPPEVLILVPVLSGAVNFALSMPILLIAGAVLHQPVGPSIVVLPVLMIGQVLLTIGLLFFFSTLNVFYRDFGQLETYFVLMLFYLTPVFYQVQSIPEAYRKFVLASPIAALIISYHDILFFGRFPAISSVAYVFAVAIVLCVGGYAFFDRFRESFGELL